MVSARALFLASLRPSSCLMIALDMEVNSYKL